MSLQKKNLNEFGLSETTMAEIRTIYTRHPAVRRVIVYGSRAMGNFREGSDIDMTIIADEDFAPNELFHIMGEFDDSMLPYLVDISVFSELKNPDLISHINRRGKILYERP